MPAPCGGPDRFHHFPHRQPLAAQDVGFPALALFGCQDKTLGGITYINKVVSAPDMEFQSRAHIQADGTSALGTAEIIWPGDRRRADDDRLQPSRSRLLNCQ